MPETVVLKKYANRRLYDTEKSAYVTLKQVADYIHDGRQVRIMDAKTEEDVTAFILTQIVLEEAKNKNAPRFGGAFFCSEWERWVRSFGADCEP